MRPTRNRVLRPLTPHARPLALKALRYGGTLLGLALLPAAFPDSGLDGQRFWSIASWSIPLLAVAGAAYLYLRNTSVGVSEGRLVATDALGRRSAIDFGQVEEVVARRLVVLDVVLIRGRDRRLVLPRGLWDLDALDGLVDVLDVPVRNQGQSRPQVV